MRRAWRRPVTPEEINAKLSLIALARKEGDSFEEGVRPRGRSLLASPNFLFRMERDPKPAPGTAPTAHPISDHELAVQALLFPVVHHAGRGSRRALPITHTLRKPGVLQAQVRRMSADPRARNLVGQLRRPVAAIRNLGRTKPDGARFGTIDDELLGYMRSETELFVEASSGKTAASSISSMRRSHGSTGHWPGTTAWPV